MRIANVFLHDKHVGILKETSYQKEYLFVYDSEYSEAPISVSMPITQKKYTYDCFPPFFDGLLPEGIMLEGLLKQHKIDRNDYFSQLMAVGHDMVGAITVEEQT